MYGDGGGEPLRSVRGATTTGTAPTVDRDHVRDSRERERWLKWYRRDYRVQYKMLGSILLCCLCVFIVNKRVCRLSKEYKVDYGGLWRWIQSMSRYKTNDNVLDLHPSTLWRLCPVSLSRSSRVSVPQNARSHVPRARAHAIAKTSNLEAPDRARAHTRRPRWPWHEYRA